MFRDIAITLKKAYNEGTAAPYWLILNPKQNMSLDIDTLAGQIEGPYFCREDAENYLLAHRHNFGQRAKVYCMSGCYSNKYSFLYGEIEKNKHLDVDKKGNSRSKESN